MLRRCHERKPTRERGRPARTTLAQPTPLSHPARPATAPGFRFSRACGVPVGGVAGCPIAGKLSGSQRHSMRARRPRSRRGASSHPSCSARRHCPCRCGGAVPLRVPSSSFVCLGGSLFFRLFPVSPAKSRFNSAVLHPLYPLMTGSSQKKAPALNEPGLVKLLAFDQYSNAMLKRADRMPARNPGSRVAVGELMLKVGWLGEYPQLA